MIVWPLDFTSSTLSDIDPAFIDLIGGRCKLADHSLLMLKFKVNVTMDTYSSEVDTVVIPTKRRPRIFPDNFLSNMCCLAWLELVSKLEGQNTS